jgi:hypothetical protein
MNIDLTAGIVRIIRPDGETAGTGFLVTDNGLIATCAHVVEAAGAGPGERVRLAFQSGESPVEAEVLTDGWYPDQDVAFLRLATPLSDGVTLVTLGASIGTSGHTFRAFGYPRMGDFQGVWAEGQILGQVTDERGVLMLQLRAQEIAPGMSGAPVLDVSTDQVVGMVTMTYQPDATLKFRDAAFAIPAEILRELCPEELVFKPPQCRREEGPCDVDISGEGNIVGDKNLSLVDKSVAININIFVQLSSLIDCSGQLKRFEQYYLEQEYFGGRQKSLAQLNMWLEQTERRNAVLSAPAGIGKSALVINWIAHLRQTGKVDIVYHPISLRFETHHRHTVLQSLVFQLVQVYNEAMPTALDVESLQSKFNNLLLDPPELERPLLLVIDGLDEIDTMPEQGIDLPKPANGIHLLVTVRSKKDGRSDDSRYWQYKLKWEGIPFDDLSLNSLDKGGVEDIVKQVDIAKHLNAQALTEKLYVLSEGDPLLLSLYLHNLQESKDTDVATFLTEDIQPGLEHYIKYTENVLKASDAYDADFLGLLYYW